MELSREEIRRVAGIARVPVGDEEMGRLEEELEAILDDFAVLDEAYGDAGEAGEGEGGPGSLRPDRVEGPDPDEVRAIRRAFPATEADLLRVPRGLP